MAYRASTVNAIDEGGADPSVAYPTLSANDILLLSVAIDGLDTITTPSGWTLLQSQQCTADNQTHNVYRKVATGSESGTLNIVAGGGGKSSVTIMASFSGRNTASPETFSSKNVLNSFTTSPASVDGTGGTAASGDDIAWFGETDGDNTDQWTFTAPTGFTERQDSAAPTWVCHSLATKDAASAGATGTISGTATRTVGSTGAGWTCIVVALAAASGSPVTVTPPAGSLSLTGQIPTIKTSANQKVLPPAGSLTLSGKVPTVLTSANQLIKPPAGSLTLAGLAPTVTATQNRLIKPPAGSLSLTGLVPTIRTGSNTNVAVPAGSLALSGKVPTIALSDNKRVSPPAGSLSLAGLAPTITVTQNVLIRVPAASLGLTAFAPTIQGSQEYFSGGFFIAYERERESRASARRRREELERDTQQIEEPTDRHIAQLLRIQEAEDERRAEFERLRTLVARHKSEPLQLSERAQKAFVRALAQQNFSAVEALDREMQRMMEEEEAVLLLILNLQ